MAPTLATSSYLLATSREGKVLLFLHSSHLSTSSYLFYAYKGNAQCGFH